MAGKLKTWIWIIVSVVVICILGVVAVAGMGYYFFSKHFDTKVTSPASATVEFETRQGVSSPVRSRSSSSTSAAAFCAPIRTAPAAPTPAARISSTCSPSIPTMSAS